MMFHGHTRDVHSHNWHPDQEAEYGQHPRDNPVLPSRCFPSPPIPIKQLFWLLTVYISLPAFVLYINKSFNSFVFGFSSSMSCGASLVAQTVRNPPAVRETWVWSLGWEDPLEEGTATHSSILAWRIPWTEEPGRLQSMGLQSFGHDWAHSTCETLPIL